jgi:hypothetical protein
MKTFLFLIISFVLICTPLIGQESATIDAFDMDTSFSDFNAVKASVEATIYGGTVKADGDYLAYWWDGDSYVLQDGEQEFWDAEPPVWGYATFDDDVYIENIAEKGNGNFKVLFRVFSNSVMDTVSNNFSVTDIIAPNAPTNLSVSNSGGNPLIQWNSNSEIDLRRYRVYRLNGDPDWFYATGTSYLDEDVEIAQQGNYINYEVKAEDWTANLSNASNQDSIRGVLGKPIAQNRSFSQNSFSLSKNFPNPFNPTTTISFNVPIRSHVELQIFDLKGQIVDDLINTSLEPGSYDVPFDAGFLPSGVYFYRISAGNFSDVKRMMLVK